MRATVVAVSWIFCLGVTSGGASEQRLSHADVKKIDRMCLGLLDTTFGDRNWEALAPYLARPDALRHAEVICSGSCRGSVPLRGGLFIDYWYANRQAKIGVWEPNSDKIYAVALRRGDKTIDSYAKKWEKRVE